MQDRGESAHPYTPIPPPPHPLREAPNLNYLWAGLLVEELVRQGVTLFVVAPGSRSAPLAAAAAANPRAHATVHFDERGAAFCALGHARATGRPAALVTTSGTAVANAWPAAVEADADGVPLLLLTADRPPELRETGANQTIRQPGLFGDLVRWRFDCPPPSLDVPAASVLTTAAQAVYRAMRAPRGPVHLNLMFREPLAPEPSEDRPRFPDYLNGLSGWLASDAPYTAYAAPARGRPEAPEVSRLRARLLEVERGLVVAGRLQTADEGAAALRLAGALGWPLLADVGSQTRFAEDGEGVRCAAYALALAADAFAAAHRPEAVVYLGGRVTSKRLDRFLASARPDPFVVVRDDPFRFDPDHLVTDRLEADVQAFTAAMRTEGTVRRGDDAWRAVWRAACEAAAGAVQEALAEQGALTEPGVAALVGREIGEGTGLVLAASMPVRDADTFMALAPDAPPKHVIVAANRGASGIDGTVATAAGFARGLGRPATLLIGDLALLHDLNSLALLRDGPPVVVVVVNNDGGGIFHFLPIAEHEGASRFFEPFFGTPHGLHFEAAARLFGLGYAGPETPAAFASDYRAATASGRSSVIEVRTDRGANVTFHRDLAIRAARAVEAALGL